MKVGNMNIWLKLKEFWNKPATIGDWLIGIIIINSFIGYFVIRWIFHEYSH